MGINNGRGPAQRPFGPALQAGFTLIELLVVVLITGILAAIAAPQYQKTVIKSRFATVKAAAKSLADAQSVYKMANGHYSGDLSELDIKMPSGTLLDARHIRYDWGECYVACDTGETETEYRCGGCRLKVGEEYKITYFYDNFAEKGLSCVVYDDAEPVYTEICKNETGKTSPDGHYVNYSFYYY